MSKRRRKFWGWGWEDEGPTAEQQEKISSLLQERFSLRNSTVHNAPSIDEISLPDVRIQPPGSLGEICSSEPYDRAGHTYGKSFRDIVRAFRRCFDSAPDLVAFPRNENEVIDILDWCSRDGIVAIPYGGGSSVVGGVEAPVDEYRPVISLDLSKLDTVLEIDEVSRAARIQAGIYGPALEDQLRPHGYTLRHFPQSFEFSTLGGWIATRSGGHFATLYTHIDDFVESLRVITPSGSMATRRLPGSGAGPSPDRMFIGSEGTLGIITEAWMRLQDRPRFRAGTAITFDSFLAGAEAARALSQSGLFPSNCRLLDPGEALTAGAGDGNSAILLVAFESADHTLDAWIERAIECCRDHGGNAPVDAYTTSRSSDTSDGEKDRNEAAGAWRQSFLGAPYLRDSLVAMGMVSETFETSITWDKFPAFHAAVSKATQRAVQEVCGSGSVTCRFTHIYPDGPAPYYSVIAPSEASSQLQHWDEIKRAAADAIIEAGGTITHHHAIGRDHRPWYDRQRPQIFARALSAAKRELDPHNILNPGVLM